MADPEPPQPDDVAAVVFTSGATGPAKGVVYRHGQIEANRDALVELYGIGSRDRLVAAFAPFALYGPAMGIASAVPQMDVTRPATLTAAHLADAVSAVAATIVWASPAALRSVVATQAELNQQQRTGLSRVRLIMSAGAPVPRPLLHQLTPLLPHAQPHTPYGMTEVLPVADADLTELDKAGDGDGVCVGHPVPGALVAISALDCGGNPIGELDDVPGVMGEIVVTAPWVKDRYDRLWATQDRSTRDGPGWHRTGDVGYFDAEGRLWVAGRLAHLITTSAGPIAPVGPEQRAESVDGVAMAACVGVGPQGAQVVVMVVVATTGPHTTDRLSLADPALAAAVRSAVGVSVAAVLTTGRLPVDVRHNSKIDRVELARRVASFLS
jgi:acyl-coenzyme A synthetase/AMP-(fatty) acid ligase